MASDRAKTALSMRREGGTYREISLFLGVGTARVRQLVFAALQEEARAQGLGRSDAHAIATATQSRLLARNRSSANRKKAELFRRP